MNRPAAEASLAAPHHLLTSLEKEWPLQTGSNLTVDHYHRASRTTETQQKGKSWSDRDI